MWQNRVARLLFVLPAIVIAGSVYLYPLFKAGEISFRRYFLYRLHTTPFVGFDNYTRLFSDPRFWNSLIVTGLYLLMVVTAIVVLGLCISGLLNRDKAASSSGARNSQFEIFLLMPIIMTPVATAILFKTFIYGHNIGLANVFLYSIGLPRVSWVTDPRTALVSVALVEIWRYVPLAVLIYHGAMRSLSPSQYEAAVLDGATRWQQFVSITMPLVRPQTVFLVVFGTIQAIRQFDIVYALTDGGPGESTLMITVFIFREAMENMNFGYATAAGIVVMLLMIVLVTLIIFGFGRNTRDVAEI